MVVGVECRPWLERLGEECMPWPEQEEEGYRCSLVPVVVVEVVGEYRQVQVLAPPDADNHNPDHPVPKRPPWRRPKRRRQ